MSRDQLHAGTTSLNLGWVAENIFTLSLSSLAQKKPTWSTDSVVVKARWLKIRAKLWMRVWIRVRVGFVTKHADQGPTGLGVY